MAEVNLILLERSEKGCKKIYIYIILKVPSTDNGLNCDAMQYCIYFFNPLGPIVM